jgi:dolichol-phosphate mannosyltransferase
MTEPQIDLSVVIFAYNEEDNIAPVLAEVVQWLQANEPNAEVVFVDDGSTDATLDAARDALSDVAHQALRHPVNRGIGAGLKTGVAAARGQWVTFLPADGQVPPAAIGTLRDAARAGADLVLSVYADRDDGARRKLLSWGVRALIYAVHGVRLRSDGPYLFRKTLFDAKLLVPDSFFLNFEFPIRNLAAGTSTRTVTVHCRQRLHGQSKSSGLSRIARVGKDLVGLRVRRTLGR